MKPNLLYRPDYLVSLDSQATLSKEFVSDAWIKPIAEQMGKGDNDVTIKCLNYLYSPLLKKEDIIYRQDILKDCLKQKDAIRDIYELVKAVIKKVYSEWLKSLSNESTDAENYSSALWQVSIYVQGFMSLKDKLDQGSFASLGLINLRKEIDEDFPHDTAVEMLCFATQAGGDYSTLIGGRINEEGFSGNYARLANQGKPRFKDWAFTPSFKLAEKDEPGAEDFLRRQNASLGNTAVIIVKTARSFTSFFQSLQDELSFYIGAINLSDKLDSLSCPYCFPELTDKTEFCRSIKGLYDISLAFKDNKAPVSNDLEYKNNAAILISGANQGGKTTFVRSLCQCQLLAQCGLFVQASVASIPLRTGFFTHFNADEESFHDSGKFVDELKRLNNIITQIRPYGVVFMNESFSSTNEKEGSIIGEEVINGLNSSHVEVIIVTHMYQLAKSLYDNNKCLLLKAERTSDGTRSFKLKKSTPEATAYGEDLFIKIFSDSD